MRVWNVAEVAEVILLSLEGLSVNAIAARLRITRKAVLELQRELELTKSKFREKWTAKQIAMLVKHFPHMRTDKVAQLCGRTAGGVNGMAKKLGLSKTKEYLASPEACRLRRDNTGGIPFRFKPGQTPVNKGLRRPGWAPGRMATTQFRKGEKPHTWRPIGNERLTKEGYLQRKVADTGSTVADYVEVHRLLWEEAHGPIPEGMVLIFRDGDKTHIVLDNLELLTRGELMKRNSVHNLPKELAVVIQLNGALKRKLRRFFEEQNVGSTQPSF